MFRRGSKQTLSGMQENELFSVGLKELYDSRESNVDIVFIHGLDGDREKSWSSKNTSVLWPKDLLPTQVPTARVLTFGYDAKAFSMQNIASNNGIGDYSMTLLDSLATIRHKDTVGHIHCSEGKKAEANQIVRKNDRPIIFVCHSLGGILCEEALVFSNQQTEKRLLKIVECTRGILFLGTPHHGADLAHRVEILRKAAGLLGQTSKKMLRVLQPDSEVLARIQHSFHAMILSRNAKELPSIELTCFFEQLETAGIGLVVPQHSAVLPGYPFLGIRSNHSNMVKFDSKEEEGFKAVSSQLRRWVLESSKSAERGFSRIQNAQCATPRSPLPDHSAGAQPTPSPASLPVAFSESGGNVVYGSVGNGGIGNFQGNISGGWNVGGNLK